jgi:hypothetical protein
MTQGLRRDIREKMHPRHQGIHGHRQFSIGGRREQGAVIADAKANVLPVYATRGKITRYESKFGKRHKTRSQPDSRETAGRLLAMAGSANNRHALA